MAVTREHNELTLRAPPGARWQVNTLGEAVLQLKRGTEEAAIAFLRQWLDTYGGPMARASAPLPASMRNESSDEDDAPAPISPEHVTARQSPQANTLRKAKVPCGASHSDATRTITCELEAGHGGSHATSVNGIWYPLDHNAVAALVAAEKASAEGAA